MLADAEVVLNANIMVRSANCHPLAERVSKHTVSGRQLFNARNAQGVWLELSKGLKEQHML